MTYIPPQITSAGLSIPSYVDIRDYLIAYFQQIYGQTVYLAPDSPDYQFISIIALALSDAVQSLQLLYNNRAPNFAIGTALDSLVKLNGLFRKQATQSLCQVTLSGIAGTVVSNGICVDVNGNKWDLPNVVTIGGGGTVTVTATAELTGAINALIGQINSILTPQAGWSSVTNPTAAIIGQPIETDAQLRGRQALSVELPSITLLAGTIAAIAATAGVTRYNVLENFTGAIDSFGNPPHSVTSVVEGGADADVAQAIYNNRGIGPLTNATSVSGATPVTVNVADPNTGIVMPIGFARPAYRQIYVTVNAHLIPGAGGSSVTITAMQTALTNYLNSLQIGETVSYTALIAVAMSAVNPNLSLPIVNIVSLFLGTAPSPAGVADITMAFTQVAQPNTIIVNSI